MSNSKQYNYAKILAIFLSVHLVISISLILFPSPVGVNKIKDMYRRYLLPGPFFSEQTITETHLLLISNKEKGEWQMPVNPTQHHYNQFYSNWNPSQMYQTRLERSVYENLQLALESGHKDDLNFDFKDLLKHYAKDQDIPKDIDSIRVILLKKVTKDFYIKTDTLQKLKF